MSRLAVVNCRQLVSLSGPARPRRGREMRELGIVENGEMLVVDGRIEAVGTKVERDSGTEVVDARGRVVLPGFVDAHAHPVFAGNRAGEFEQRIAGASYAEIAAAGGGIRSTVRQTRAASEQDLLQTAERYRTWFLRGGTTTVEAKSGYGLSLESELKILRVIRTLGPQYVPTFLGAHEVPDEFREQRDRYVELVIGAMLPAVKRENLATYCDIFCEPGTFPLDASRRILNAAHDLGFSLRVHADQFTADYGALLAAECKAVTADHLEQTTEVGMRALADAGVMPVLLPASVYALGLSKYADARGMIELGMPVVLATDFNPGSSPTTSMPMVLSLACTQMRMTPAEGIVATTVNPSWSLGRGQSIGSLEPGKAADFVIHDCGDYREIPYFFGRDSAHEVFIGGQRVHLRNEPDHTART